MKFGRIPSIVANQNQKSDPFYNLNIIGCREILVEINKSSPENIQPSNIENIRNICFIFFVEIMK